MYVDIWNLISKSFKIWMVGNNNTFSYYFIYSSSSWTIPYAKCQTMKKEGTENSWLFMTKGIKSEADLLMRLIISSKNYSYCGCEPTEEVLANWYPDLWNFLYGVTI